MQDVRILRTHVPIHRQHVHIQNREEPVRRKQDPPGLYPSFPPALFECRQKVFLKIHIEPAEPHRDQEFFLEIAVVGGLAHLEVVHDLLFRPFPAALNLLKNEIKSQYVNRELIAFMQELTDMLKSRDDKYYLLFCKKVTLQTQRMPDSNHYEVFKEEYNQFFEETKEEQAILDPLKWIDAEMEFIDIQSQHKEGNRDNENDKNQFPPQQGLLTFDEMMNHLRTTKLALRRRMEEGMPCFKLGIQWRFELDKVNAWLATQN